MNALDAGIFSEAGADGWGARLWEYLHPGQVRAEYGATGEQAPPDDVTLGDVLMTARGQVIETATAAGEQLTAGASLLKTALIAGGVLYGAHLLLEAWNATHARRGRK